MDVATSAVSTTLPSTSNEVRLVLEANVRAMQASFQHNQRTLEISLRMADTLRDGVRVLADAQADWIKSLASSKGYLRNAATAAAQPPLPATLASPGNDDDHDTEEDEDDEPPEPRHWVDVWGEKLTPFVAPVAVQLAQQFTSRASSTNGNATASTPGKDGGGVWDKTRDTARDLFDWRRAAEKGAAKRAKDAYPKASSPGGLMALVAGAPADVVAKVMGVVQSLTSAEREALMELMGALDPEDMPAVVSELRALSPDELLAKLRTLATPPSHTAPE